MNETYYDRFQLYFAEEIIYSHYMCTDSFLLNVKTNDINKHLEIIIDWFDLRKMNKNHETFNN